MTTSSSWRPSAALTGGVAAASVLAMDPAGWYPFGPAKWHAVLLMVVVALWSTSLAGVTSMATRHLAGYPFRGEIRWMGRAWLALLAVLGLAAVFGREPLYGWIGTPERRLGWLTWVLFAAAFWLGARHAGRTDRRVVARVVALSTAALGCYSMFEMLVRAPVQVDTVGQRIGGPYGSAAFLGAALCLLVPASAGLAFDRTEHRVWRVIGGIAAGTGSVALVGSGTRAAFVGLAAAILVVVGARVRSRRVALRLAGVVAAVVLVGLGGSVASERVADNLGRVVDVADSSRFAEWGVGARIVAAHPILGVGPEGYRTALADGITADYERTYGRDVIPDRAHNGVIDVAAAGGLGAGALYVILLAVLFAAAWRHLRRSDATVSGLAVAAIAYGLQQMFLFPVSVIDPLFWVFAGILCIAQAPGTAGLGETGLANPGTADTGPVDTGLGPARPVRSVPRWMIQLGFAALVTVIVGSGVLALSADRLAAQAVRNDRADLASRADRLRPDFVRYWLLEDRLQPLSISGIAAGLDSIESAERVSPRDPVVRRRRAERLLDRAVATGDAADALAALDAWADLAVDRNCYRCQLGYGYALAINGDRTGALAAFERAASLARVGDDEASRNVAALRASTDRAGNDPAAGPESATP